MSTAPEIYINSTSPMDEDDERKVNAFLDEMAPIYRFYVERSSSQLGWRLDFPSIDGVVTFMRSFYSQKYILKTIPSVCNVCIMGQDPVSQMLMQQNMAIMAESIADNTDAGEYVMNDQIKEVMTKLNGIDEFNKRNNLYTFKHVIEALLDTLSEQGLVRNGEKIKDTVFPKTVTVNH